ncbi:CPBP family intramembrane glutamic endopeptidase [Aurantiacibacter aquimixticola]|uniref:CPBP family intramembrane metalloprotease n=1 Tax=Aurantiacibacter aquimixticola TaxID=1958945 RepID=A0A419RR46_9SPHN|nr:type II CAAX endopeptidase family protein [Aurantiacibacter aquimixticola]RJY08247.1 CPBP family intramembrane metalloprotease [Aurantiacibacter aquimixticola]
MNGEVTARDDRSIWLKIWQFPLVAMMVAVALLVLAGIATSALFTELLPDAFGGDWQQVVALLTLTALSFVIYKLAIRHLGRKKHDDLPLDLRAIKDTALGFAGGGALITICVALAALFGVYTVSGMGAFSDWPAIVLMAGIYAGFFEELLLRGVIFRWLEEFAGSWIALALSSLIFGFGHAGNDNATFFSSLAIAIEAGILLGAAYMLTRSLWLAVGLHAGWNVVQGMWDVPISGNDFDGIVDATMSGPALLAGGGFGLEATVFALLVATGAGLWMLVLAARRGRIVKPSWSRKGHPITAY